MNAGVAALTIRLLENPAVRFGKIGTAGRFRKTERRPR
jgi:hypothetical protein